MKTAAPHSSEPAPLQGLQLWLVAMLLASANFIAVLDATIANVSMPHIAGSLSITASQCTWVVTSYSVAEAIAVPLAGWLAARFGPVRVLVTAMTCFAVFSALCGLAGSLGFLVTARIFQGLAGAPMMPMSQALLRRIFPKEKLMTALGIWAMTAMLAPIAGPVIGGWLCDHFSWPWIFYVNVPIALLCGRLIRKRMGPYEQATRRMPVDLVGLGLLVLWVGSLELMLDHGREQDWFQSPWICGLCAVSVIGFIAFLIWELTEEHPIVDLRIFRHHNFRIGVLTLALVFGANFGGNILTPLWLQTGMGYTAGWAGLTTFWMGLCALLITPHVSKVARFFDQRLLVFCSVLWISLVTAMLRAGSTTDMGYWNITLPLMLTGLAMPFYFLPLNAITLAGVPQQETANAAGLISFIRTLAGAFGGAVYASLWESRIALNHADLAAQANSVEGLRSLQAIPAESQAPLLDQLVQGQSVMLATNQVLLVVALSFCLGGCVIWLAHRPQMNPATGGAR